jgi:hypothetical protein
MVPVVPNVPIVEEEKCKSKILKSWKFGKMPEP